MSFLKYEIISLLRDKWIQTLSLLLLILCLFAGFNGKNKVEKRNNDITAAITEMEEGDAMAIAFIDSAEAGFTMKASSWTRPDKATAIGNYHPRVAAMPPSGLAMVSTGQSDLFTHYVKPTISGDEIALNFAELTSPVQLLFGSFDLAFVLVYLLPLIVIAFTYNLLSAEREHGSLRLVASQPISTFKWLLYKAGLRFTILGAISLLSTVLVLLVFGVNLLSITGSFFQLALLILGYLIFWFMLGILINLTGNSSANNAVSLLAFWVLFVLLIPSTINQMAVTIYPMPSRTQMINDMRVIKAETTKKQDEVLDAFLRDHPELIIENAEGEGSAYNWWSKYFASKELIKSEMAPMVNDFESRLEKQQDWVKQWRFISPAMVLQSSLNNIAGTSSVHYEAYRQQVIVFSEEWRSFLLPLIFKDQKVTTDVVASLPKFTFRENVVASNFGSNIIGLVILTILLGIIGYYQQSKRALALT